MTTLFIVFCVGAIFGAVVTGPSALVILSRPRDREVIEVGLKKILPSHQFVPIEWIYFHMELSPKDILTLRHVLELYTEEGVMESIENNGAVGYKLTVNALT